jgi:hypothetical protein
MTASRIVLCTSQPPLSAQQRHDARGCDVTTAYADECRRSWFGFTDDVISINSLREAAGGVERLVPRVQYVARDLTATTGKPLVKLDDLIEAGLGLDSSHLALVNADIILHADARAAAASLRDSEFMAENRKDTSSVRSTDGPDYPYGFDFFVLQRSAAAQLLGTDFAIGVPWWDHFVPVALLLDGGTLAGGGTGLALSLTHHSRWTPDAWRAFGRHFVEEVSGRVRPRHLASRRFRRYVILMLAMRLAFTVVGASGAANADRISPRLLRRVSRANLRLIADARPHAS